MIIGYPAVCSLSCPHPPPPLPDGKGETLGYFMQGASPLASPGAEPGRHWLFLWKAMPEGGLSPGLPAGSAVPVPEGGLPALSPADLAFSFLFCPHPPHPLPGGKGENHSFLMQGASPLASPGLNPGGTGFSFGRRCPKGGLPPGLPAGSAVPVPEGRLACFVACRPCRLFAFLPPSPRPPSRREGGVSKFISPGASPPAPLRPGGKRHWLFLWKAVPQGGFAPCIPGQG